MHIFRFTCFVYFVYLGIVNCDGKGNRFTLPCTARCLQLIEIPYSTDSLSAAKLKQCAQPNNVEISGCQRPPAPLNRQWMPISKRGDWNSLVTNFNQWMVRYWITRHHSAAACHFAWKNRNQRFQHSSSICNRPECPFPAPKNSFSL